MNDLVLVQGLRDSRTALERWQRAPMRVLRPWFVLSLLIAAEPGSWPAAAAVGTSS